MRHLSLTLLLLPILFGATNCSTQDKYQAQNVENCVIMTKWDAINQVQVSNCFCIDKRVNDEDSFTELVHKVSKNMSNHPEAKNVIDKLIDIKDIVIAKHEYTLHIQYCKYFETTNPKDKAYLETWAEDNRLGRVKAEIKAKK